MGYRFDVAVHAPSELAYKMPDQQRDIFFSFTQRGQHDREDTQAIVQITTKLVLSNSLGQITVGGRHQAHIHLNSAIAAQALKFLILQYAEQLGLQLKRNLANFVVKQSSTLGKFQTADLMADGSRESSLFVSEELTFQQAGRNCRAV